jgi:prevent-host-death family protein
MGMVLLVNVGQECAMADPINLYDAKTNLSQLVERAAAGEEIIIAKAGRPMARLVRLQERTAPRAPGLLKGQISIGPEFESPLPDDLARWFRGDGA